MTGMFIASIAAGSTVALRNKSSTTDYLAGTGIDHQAVNHAAILLPENRLIPLSDDAELTQYLWSIVREMIKTDFGSIYAAGLPHRAVTNQPPTSCFRISPGNLELRRVCFGRQLQRPSKEAGQQADAETADVVFRNLHIHQLGLGGLPGHGQKAVDAFPDSPRRCPELHAAARRQGRWRSSVVPARLLPLRRRVTAATPFCSSSVKLHPGSCTDGWTARPTSRPG